MKNKKGFILEGFFAIDKILFGDKNPKKIFNENVYSKYVKSKAEFLMNLSEFYNSTGIKSHRKYNTLNELYSLVKSDVEDTKDYLIDSVLNQKYSSVLNEGVSLLENSAFFTNESAKDYVLPRHLLTILMDSFFVYNYINDDIYKEMNNLKENVEFNVLMDSYDIFRANLVEFAFLV